MLPAQLLDTPSADLLDVLAASGNTTNSTASSGSPVAVIVIGVLALLIVGVGVVNHIRRR